MSLNQNMIYIFPIKGIPLIKYGDDIVQLIINSLQKEENAEINNFQDGDILVISHTALCKALGYTISLDDIKPSDLANYIASDIEKSLSFYKKLNIIKSYEKPNPSFIQLILNNSTTIIRTKPFLITQSTSGSICSNSGIDKSNVEGQKNYVYLPPNPNFEAESIRKKIFEITKKNIAVIISDSQGRPFRIGTVGVSIGFDGISPFVDYRGKKDLYGYILKDKICCIVDALASSAQLVMGESSEGIPAVLIRGFRFENYDSKCSNKNISYPEINDMFRNPTPYDFLTGLRQYAGIFSEKIIPEPIIECCLEMFRNFLSNIYSSYANHENFLKFIEINSTNKINDIKSPLINNIKLLSNLNTKNLDQLISQIKSASCIILILKHKKLYIDEFSIISIISYLLLTFRVFDIYTRLMLISSNRKSKLVSKYLKNIFILNKDNNYKIIGIILAGYIHYTNLNAEYFYPNLFKDKFIL